jgi:carboxyl-terminal processing protease
MSKSRLGFLVVSLACLMPFLAGALSRGEEGGEDSLYRMLSVFSEVLSLVQRVYVDEVPAEGLVAGALDGATDALDALATYVPPQALSSYAEVRAVGAGRSGVLLAKERGVAFVAAVAEDGPGAAVGLEAGDVIARVDGTPTRGMPLWRLQQLFAGEPGARLTLEVLAEGQSREAALELAAYEVPLPHLEARPEAAILHLTRFDAPALAETRRLLAGLAQEGKDRLLVDLRGVVGGPASGGYAAAGLFVSGDLGELAGREGTIEIYASTTEPVWRGRTVALVDRGTLGGAEIVAAALHAAGGVPLVGEPTFGHAGRERLVDLPGGGGLLLTDAFFTGPDREPLATRLVPEVFVRETSRRFGEEDVPLAELILRRGVEKLGEAEPAAEAA